MAWKNTLPAGLVYEHPVISLDIAATALAVVPLVYFFIRNHPSDGGERPIANALMIVRPENPAP